MWITLLVILVFITAFNVAAYIWAYKRQSDVLTDISYSLSFIAVAMYGLYFWGPLTYPRVVLAGMVLIWALRLGGFLFYRIHKMGRDTRFDDFRESKIGFLKFWILQSISIWIIALPFMVGLYSNNENFNTWGIVIFLLGWIIEAVADYQKFSFRNNKKNEGKFIQTGLYTWLRHPNYLGEILCWLGIFLFVSPMLIGTSWLVIISPIWVIILLLFISGIPLIKVSNLKKYNHLPEYHNYLKKTWHIFPFIY